MTKQIVHKLFILVSAAVVFHAVMLLMTMGGRFNPGVLMFYTALTNLLIVVGFLLMALPIRWTRAFRSYVSFGMIVCISVTGIVYNFVLVPFAGLPLIFSDYINFATHLFSMLLVWANYLIFEENGSFTYKHVWAGLIPTLLYWLVFVSIGELIGFYPYFFMDPTIIGWPMVFVWFFIISGFFLAGSFALVRLDKRGSRDRKESS